MMKNLLCLLFLSGAGTLMQGCFMRPDIHSLPGQPELAQLSSEMRGRNASAAMLGAVGHKVRGGSGNQQGYFERFHVPPYPALPVAQLGQLDITDTVVREMGSIGVNVDGIGGISGGVKSNGSQKLQVNLLDIPSTLDFTRLLAAQAAADPDLKAFLRRPDARVVTTIGVVATYTSSSDSGASIDLTAGRSFGVYKVQAALKGQSSRVTEFKISPDTTILYRLSKICWLDADKFSLQIDHFGSDDCANQQASR